MSHPQLHDVTVSSPRPTHNHVPASSFILLTPPILEYCAFLASLPFLLPMRTSCECEHPLVPMPLAAQISGQGHSAVSATRLNAQQLSRICFQKRGVLLQLLCFFVEGGIGACSLSVSPTTYNRFPFSFA